MEEKILYYFGAGASAKVLPLARTRVKPNTNIVEIKGLAYELENFLNDPVIRMTTDGNSQKVIQDIRARVKTIVPKANEFGDVDTYAKYLNLMNKNGDELKDVKKTLSQYFAIKQMILNARDSRYLPWLVGVMNRKDFPANIKILSWNYDFQIELAATTFWDNEDIIYGENNFVHTPSSFNYYPNLDPTFDRFDDLSLVHLNGIAGFMKIDDRKSQSVFQQSNLGPKEKIFTLIGDGNMHELLHFAWENSNYHRKLMKHVKRMIEKTTIVVVIGYSFPFFNREIDKEVFRNLSENGTLRKIYYQDPVLDGQQLRAQFGIDKSIDIIHVKQTDSFHVPFEY